MYFILYLRVTTPNLQGWDAAGLLGYLMHDFKCSHSPSARTVLNWQGAVIYRFSLPFKAS